MRTIINRIHNMLTGRIRNKLISVFVLIWVIHSIGIITVYSLSTMSEKKSDFTDSNLRLLVQTNINVNNIVEQVDKSMLAAFQDNQIWENLSRLRGEQLAARLEVSNYLFSVLLNLYNSTPNTISVGAYLEQANRLYVMDRYTLGESPVLIDSSYSFILPFTANPDTDLWYSSARDNPEKMNISINQTGNLDRLKDQIGTFALSRTLYHPLDHHEIITLWFNLQSDIFQDIENQVTAENEVFFVLSADGTVIYTSEQISGEILAEITSGITRNASASGSLDLQSPNRSLVLYDRSELTGWYLVKQIDYAALMAGIKQHVLINTLVGIAFLIVGVIAVIIVSIRIAKPIHKLISVVNSVERDGLKVQADISGRDEISRLAHKFNEMMASIQSLISREYKAKIKEKEARLEALQTKINPHFLNNTLQTISSIAIETDNDRIEKMVQALSSIMRYSLSKGNQMSTVRDELDNIRSYLHIQKFRYADRLDVQYDIDERTLHLEMPALILQPIVENAITHGIEPKIGDGHIHISTSSADGILRLTVSDNGIGIPEHRLQELQRNLMQYDEINAAGASGNGIMNVHKRIEYLYGNQYGLRLESKHHTYTNVAITLPVQPAVNNSRHEE